MLRSLKEFIGSPVITWDGPLGEVQDLLFDKLDWRLRYFLVSVGERQALLVPDAITLPKAGDKPLQVDLSREQIIGSPRLPETPLTREYEATLHDHYGWELYNLDMETDADDDEQFGVNQHLRSLRQVAGSPLHARDGRAGELVDFIVNDENWALFYMVVRLGGLLEGEKEVLLPPSWIEEMGEAHITVDLAADTIRNGRPYEPAHLNDDSPAS